MWKIILSLGWHNDGTTQAASSLQNSLGAYVSDVMHSAKTESDYF